MRNPADSRPRLNHGQANIRGLIPEADEIKAPHSPGVKSIISVELVLAYRRTAYVADTSDGKITIRIGSGSALLDHVLAEHHAHEWAYLSASNPGSKKQNTAENNRRFHDLQAALQDKGKEFFTGYSRADGASWPDEKSALVIGISLNEALEIGRSFGQLALVSGVRGGRAKLIDCRSGKLL